MKFILNLWEVVIFILCCNEIFHLKKDFGVRNAGEEEARLTCRGVMAGISAKEKFM